MKFSIIIPVYNVAPYLRECLDSVLAQTFTVYVASVAMANGWRGFLKPQSEFRKTMFARIEEFVASCINGPVFVDSVQSALDFFAKGETVSYNRAAIDSRRTASLEWLKKAIG